MESKKLDNGYICVEFTPAPGKRNIAAVASTSALGGQNAFGSAGRGCQHISFEKVDIGDIPKAKQMTLFEAVELDFEKNCCIPLPLGLPVTITKIRIPVFNI